MKKFLFIILMLLALPAFADNQWRGGAGENTILGTENVSDIDAASLADIVDPLDRLLTGYRENMTVVYASASSLSVGAGEVVVSNAGGTIKMMMRNTAATTVTFSDIDTGAEASATTYYLYAISTGASVSTSTFKISASSTAPSGATYYKKLASFYNNASSNIDKSQIYNYDGYVLATGTAANGATLTAPTGFAISECRAFVSINNLNGTGLTWTLNTGSSVQHFNPNCAVNQDTFLVTCVGDVNSGTGTVTLLANVNYILFCRN